MMLTYETWLKHVDLECWRRGGMSVGDLPDVNYREMFNNRVSPKSAACRALKNAGDF